MSGVLLAGGLCLVFAVFVKATTEQFATIYPTADMQSAFLRDYLPEAVLKSAVPGYGGSGGAGSNSSSGSRFGAGNRYVTNTRDFEPCFVLRDADHDALMTALSDDMEAQLRHDGAEVLSQSGDPHSGIRVRYKLGKNIGTATIAPFAASDCMGHYTVDGTAVPRGLRPDKHVVLGNISISEKWFPKELTTEQARVEAPMR